METKAKKERETDTHLDQWWPDWPAALRSMDKSKKLISFRARFDTHFLAANKGKLKQEQKWVKVSAPISFLAIVVDMFQSLHMFD